MFQHAGDDVTALRAGIIGDALDRQVVGLGCAGGPDNGVDRRTHRIGHLRACLFNGLPRHLPITVPAGCRITEMTFAAHTGNHGFDDLFIDRRGSGVIQVERRGGHGQFTL